MPPMWRFRTVQIAPPHRDIERNSQGFLVRNFWNQVFKFAGFPTIVGKQSENAVSKNDFVQ